MGIPNLEKRTIVFALVITLSVIYAFFGVTLFVENQQNKSTNNHVVALTGFARGNGSYSSPYEIETKAHLDNLNNIVMGGNDCSGVYFALKTDIDFGGAEIGIGGWNSSTYTNKAFKGIFDGCNHVLSNFKIKSYYYASTTRISGSNISYYKDYTYGLFACVEGCKIRNLKITNYSATCNETDSKDRIKLETVYTYICPCFAGLIGKDNNDRNSNDCESYVLNCWVDGGTFNYQASNANKGYAASFIGGELYPSYLSAVHISCCLETGTKSGNCNFSHITADPGSVSYSAVGCSELGFTEDLMNCYLCGNGTNTTENNTYRSKINNKAGIYDNEISCLAGELNLGAENDLSTYWYYDPSGYYNTGNPVLRGFTHFEEYKMQVKPDKDFGKIEIYVEHKDKYIKQTTSDADGNITIKYPGEPKTLNPSPRALESVNYRGITICGQQIAFVPNSGYKYDKFDKSTTPHSVWFDHEFITITFGDLTIESKTINPQIYCDETLLDLVALDIACYTEVFVEIDYENNAYVYTITTPNADGEEKQYRIIYYIGEKNIDSGQWDYSSVLWKYTIDDWGLSDYLNEEKYILNESTTITPTFKIKNYQVEL